MMLIRDGGYLDEILNWSGVEGPVSVTLQLVTIHDQVQTLKRIDYPVQTANLQLLLDTFHLSEGNVEQLQREITSRTIADLLSSLDPSLQEDSCLVDLLQSVKQDKTTLRDERTLPAEVLIGYECPYVATVVTDLTSAVPLYAVCTTGEHNHLCQAAAAARKVPQRLSDRMHTWVSNCLKCGLSIDDVDALLFNQALLC